MKTHGSLVATLRIGAFLSGLLLLNTVQAYPLLTGWENHTGSAPGFTIGPRFTLFSTDHNYDFSSQSVPILNKVAGTAVSVQRYYVDVNASYGFSENFFLFARLSALSTKITGSTILDPSSLGLADQMIGAAYRLFQTTSGLSINFQTEVSLPAYSNSTSKQNGKPYLGDGSTDLTFGGFAEVPISLEGTYSIYLDGGAGYTMRSYGFSTALPWNLLLKRYPNQNGGLTFSLGARGNISMDSDLTTLKTSSDEQILGAGGSMVYDAINPSWTLGQASIGYQTATHTSFTLNGAIPLAGKNVAQGMQISFGIQFDFTSKSGDKNVSSLVRPGSFKQYDLEGKVLSTNDQLYLVKIDKGSDQGVEKGQIFDIFSEKQAIARAKVTNVNGDESVLRVLEYYQEQSIEVDAVAKRVVQ